MKLIGKQKQKAFFDAVIKNGGWGQFYILEGPRGVGKKALTAYAASALHCQAEHKPCGICGACIKHKSGNHPDYCVIKNEGPERENITVDTVRRISEDIFVKPLISDVKIYVLDGEKPLGVEGQNAFLKVLEEPPSYAVIFLLTESSDTLLPTVVSRGLRLRVDPCSREETVSYITARFPEKASQAQLIAGLSGGVLGLADSFCEDEEFLTLRSDFYAALQAVKSGEASWLLEAAAFMEKKKERMPDLLNLLIIWLRDIIYIKTADGEGIINSDYRNELLAFASHVKADKVIKTLDAAQSMAGKYSKKNNTELWILDLLTNLG